MDLQHLIYVFGIELIVSQSVNQLHVVDNSLSEIRGVNVIVLSSIGVLSHIEGALHLVVQGVNQVWQELLVDVNDMEVPVEVNDVVQFVFFVVEICVLQVLQDPVLLEVLRLRIYLFLHHLLLFNFLLFALSLDLVCFLALKMVLTIFKNVLLCF